VLWAFVLFGETCHCYALNIDEISNDDLVFVPFEPFIPCGDGSPAGIYQEVLPGSGSGKNHVMMFLGGGVCTNAEDCRKKLETDPYQLSSKLWPQSLKGSTILSRNATENPVASGFTRWVIPYCSQDLFLGNGNPSTEIKRAGDVVFESALNHWKDSLESESIDTLIVGGISAGAIALLNHVGSVQRVSKVANVNKLRLIFDSVSVASRTENIRDTQAALEEIVDFDKHPLCNLTYTMNFQTTELWNIPCCVSIHCMLENDPIIRELTQTSDENGTERLLLLDSIYDAHVILKTSSNVPSNPSILEIDALTSEVMEAGGARGQQFLQSTYGSINRLGNRVLWAVSNVVGHVYLVPALEIDQLRCDFNQDTPIKAVCREDGFGFRGKLFNGLEATAWLTTESWKLCTVNKDSIQNIIFDFVHAKPENMSYGLVRDVCSGPNCVPIGVTDRNPAQALFVLEEEFVSISLASKSFVLFLVLCLMFAYTLRFLPVKLKSSEHKEEDLNIEEKVRASALSGVGESDQKGTIQIIDVTVKVIKTERILLNSLFLKIVPGTIIGLHGPSGAGKTTLFNLLCGQLPAGLQGFAQGKSEEFKALEIHTSYLRQFGNSSFQNIELISYVTITAKLYGVTKFEMEEALSFLRKSFGDCVGKDSDFGGIKICQLSGGQQRIAAIVVTLLTRPKLLLLDEPLSGLDSVSSLVVMQLLRDLVTQHKCSIVLSMHQPSDKILELMDDILVLQGGTLTLNESIHAIKQRGHSPSDLIHETLEKYGKHKHIQKRQKRVSIRRSILVVENSNQHEDTSTIKSFRLQILFEIIRFGLWQIQPMMRRMQLEYKPRFVEFFELPFWFVLVSILLRFDDGSPFQLLLVSALFCSLPVFLFQEKLHGACMNFQAHQLELEDGRISPTAYFLASFLYLVSVPVISLAFALVIGYLILGWDFGTYIDQFLLSVIHMLLSFQIGRVLITIFNGSYGKMGKAYAFYKVFSFALSGLLVSPNKLPPYIAWLTYISFGFWSVAGISLVQFATLGMGGDNCSSLQSCIILDKAFLAWNFGYAPIATTQLAYVVLLLGFALFFVVEYAMLRYKFSA